MAVARKSSKRKTGTGKPRKPGRKRVAPPEAGEEGRIPDDVPDLRRFLEDGRYERGSDQELCSEELIARYREEKDGEARDTLVERHLPDVAYLARNLHSRLPPTVDVEDLCNAGYGGLLRCIETYDPGKGSSFQAYLKRRVSGAMLDELRAMDWLPRLLRSRLGHRDRVVQELRQELGREPDEEEIARGMGMEMEAYRRAFRPGMAGQSAGGGRGLETELPEGGSVEIGGRVGFEIDLEMPWTPIYHQELMERIQTLLSETEWTLVHLHYFEGLKLREVARRMKLSPARICQIHGRLLARLKERLADEVNA